MKWYVGGIAEAITASKAKGAIFVVYIEGLDEQSKKITNLIDNGILGENLEKEHFVAIKLEAGSVPHQQFGEIYKEPSIPSIYFIGKNGSPLDIITGKDDLHNVSKRIEDILAKAGIVEKTSVAVLTENLIQNEQASGSGNIVCENGVCKIKTDIPDSSNQETSPGTLEKQELTPEEKIERAKELLEKKREQKEAEEKENERLKEIERRKVGQGVQQIKKWQEDQEMKQMIEERDKEKRENQIARERVLAQIAQDKAERLAKSQPQTSPADAPKIPVVPTLPRVNSNTTKLQFKLPDGSSNLQEFGNSDSLQTVISYIRANMKLPFNNFKLSTTFPRREFSANDYSQSLLDLQLCPNAVILILPLNNGTISTNPGGTFTAIIWGLLAPIMNIFGYLKTFIFGTNPNIGGNKRPSEEPAESRPTNPKRRMMRDSTVVKRQGNVHRLSDRTDSDDDDGNTWNGNSTQQM